MNVLWGFLITVGATAVAVAAMLLVRRRAPEGSYFADGDRASGVFGVLATGFSVLLGFIIFLAFSSYDQSRSGRGGRGARRGPAGRDGPVLPSRVVGQLTGELVCYGRSVVHGEWERMEAGTQGDAINPWAVALFQTVKGVEPDDARASSPPTTSGSTRRRLARRLAGIASTAPSGVIPTPLWIVLFFISAVIFVYMLFFADSGERAVTQAHADGLGDVGDLDDAAAARLPRQPVPVGCRGPATGRDGADVADDRRGASSLGGPDRTVRVPCDAEGRAALSADATPPGRPGRGRRHRAPRAGDGRHRVERLPGEPLERRAGKGVQPRQRSPHRVDARLVPRDAQTQIDVATFTQWVDAYAREETLLADFYFARFRAEFKPAVDAWIATRPLETPTRR